MRYTAVPAIAALVAAGVVAEACAQDPPQNSLPKAQSTAQPQPPEPEQRRNTTSRTTTAQSAPEASSDPMRTLSEAADQYAWPETDAQVYTGFFVDMMGYVSEAIEIEDGQVKPKSGQASARPGQPSQKILAFVEDRGVTGILTDKAHLPILDPAMAEELEQQIKSMLNQRVEVMARKYERDGLNLLRVEAISPAPLEASKEQTPQAAPKEE